MKIRSRRSKLFYAALALMSLSLATVGCASGDGDDEDEASGGDGDSLAGDGDASGGTSGDGDNAGDGDAEPEPMGVCDITPPVAPEGDVVSDLEDGAAGWDVYVSTPKNAEPRMEDRVADMDGMEGNDAVITAPSSGDPEDDPETVSDGANESESSVSFAGTGWDWWGGGINYNLEGCKDLSAYEGVSFWAKGSTTTSEEQREPSEDNALNFRVITAGSHAIIEEGGVNVGGDCDDQAPGHKCFMPPQIDIELTGEWKEYRISFSDLKTPAGANRGSAINADQNNIMLLGWHTVNPDFEIYIDEVSFY